MILNPKLLIVDDERGIVDMIQSYFQTQYDILTAYSGQEALKKVACKPDLILLDINMPGMDGLTVCQQIREHIACPILFLTARIESSDKIIGFQAGADDYIAKPFSIHLLKGKIANQLKARQRLKHYYSNTIDIDTAKMTSNNLDEEFMSKAIQVVEENISNEDFTSDELASQLCMSRSSLYLKMNSISGEPPANFIRRIRFNKACKLLLEGRYSISEISGMAGFGSSSYFSTSFKKYVGCLPSEYVKQHTK